MNVDIISAFRQAAASVLESYGFGETRLDDVLVCRESCTRDASLGVSIEFSGDIAGVLGFVFPRAHLAKIAAQVVRMPVPPDDVEDQQNIATELVNIVAGHAMGQLYGQGLGVDIQPPVLAPGPRVDWRFVDGADTVVVPVHTDRGPMELLLSVRPE